MTKLPSSSVIFSVTVTFLTVIIYSFPSTTHALGSGSTLAVSYLSATVCAIVGGQSTQRLVCYRRGNVTSIQPSISFSSISGGESFFCGVRSGGYTMLCWDTTINSSFARKRLYFNATVLLNDLSVGNNQVCATTSGGEVNCWWRGNTSNDNVTPSKDVKFESISSGFGFSCGLLRNTRVVQCWGSNSVANEIQNEFGNKSMLSITAGANHVCGIDRNGFLVCHGQNESGQLNIPSNFTVYKALALGVSHSCAIRWNGSVDCWGGGGAYSVHETEGVSFESIVSGSNFTCGLITKNLSVMCWGPGWPNESNSGSGLVIPFNQKILPGPCVESSSCNCGFYPDSDSWCLGSGTISVCQSCLAQNLIPNQPPPLIPPAPSPSTSDSCRSSPSRELTRGLLAFAIVGSVGAVAGICTIIYCLWSGVCFGKKKIHNSVQPTITRAGSNGGATSNNSPPSRSSTIRRQGSKLLTMRRQRSGTSSKHADRAEEFSLAELVAATKNFSLENKIGAGSFGIVYKGKLSDGREVAIKRGETAQKRNKFQEKESAFESELAFLSRLHHKHLVRLVGYCEEEDEKLLVYEYMKNGALYDHLHDKSNVEKSSSIINSWKMRIKIALDASRGIEYLHNYAVPPIIHRDIKSSNILIDAYWTARVSDFGLSLMGPESERDFRPMKAAGTVGYIDPEYYGLNVLTAKSDVYGLGVVLLELLTGKRAIFKIDDNGGAPVSIVDFAVPAIMAGELVKILDRRVGAPELNEAEAVELVAYTAMHCVNLEGKERPTMADIVANLERALALCDDSHGSISSGTMSIGSD